jgi:hypothetical protein
VASLGKWAEHAGEDQVAVAAIPFLLQTDALMKGELMSWLVAHKAVLPIIDCKPFVPGLLFCLQDRSA